MYKTKINENRKIVHAHSVYKAEKNEIRWPMMCIKKRLMKTERLYMPVRRKIVHHNGRDFALGIPT